MRSLKISLLFLFVLVLVSAQQDYEQFVNDMQQVQNLDDLLEGTNDAEVPFYKGTGKRYYRSNPRFADRGASPKDMLRMYLKMKQY